MNARDKRGFCKWQKLRELVETNSRALSLSLFLSSSFFRYPSSPIIRQIILPVANEASVSTPQLRIRVGRLFARCFYNISCNVFSRLLR